MNSRHGSRSVKRAAVLGLILVTSLGLSSCGSNESSGSPGAPETPGRRGGLSSVSASATPLSTGTALPTLPTGTALALQASAPARVALTVPTIT